MGLIKHAFSSPVADGADPTLVRPSDWNSVHNFTLVDGVSLSGNTAGVLAAVSSGTLYLAGGNNVTLSQSQNSITISGANAGGAQTGISGLAAGTQTATSGTVSFADSNGISFGLSGSTRLTASYTVPAVPPETPFALSAGTQSVSTGTLKWADSNGISFGMSGSSQVTASYTVPAVTAGSDTLGMSNLGNTSGTTGVVSGDSVRYLFAGGNNVTLSQSLNGLSGTVTISAFNQTAESNTLGMSNLGNTSGTSGVVSAAQVALYLAGGNNVTLSQSLNGASGTVTISAFNQTVESQSLGMSNVGNTSGTTGVASGGQVRFVFAGGNNITLSQSLNGASGTITISAPNLGAGAGFTAGVSTGGNTSGNTGTVSASVIFAGGNNVTLSQATGAGGVATVTISAFNQSAESQTAGMSNLGNTSGTTGVASGAQIALYLAGGNNVTLSQSVNGASATITISAGPVIGATKAFGMGVMSTAGGAFPDATLQLFPFVVPAYLTAHTAALYVSASGATGSSAGASQSVGVYTLNGGTLSLATSGSWGKTWTSNSVAAGDWLGFLGVREWQITDQTFQFTPGNYVVGVWQRSTNAGSYSMMGVSGGGTAVSGVAVVVTNASQTMMPWFGMYSASVTTAMPASVASSDVSRNFPGANPRFPDFMFRNSTWK